MKTVFLLSFLCGLPVASQATAEQSAAEPVVARRQGPDAESGIIVEVASGRKFTAQVDAHTDQTRLWLRRQQGSAAVLRPVQWDRVVRVRLAGTELSGEEFLGIVKRLRPTVAAPVPLPTGKKTIVLVGTVGPADSAASEKQSVPPPERPRVRSLVIEVAVARWDAHVEVDGLLVHVYPLSAAGEVVPVYGTLEVEWIGRRTDVIDPEAAFCRLGHWTSPVREGDFGLDGAVYRLPFQGVHPEFDLAVAMYGAVHARLSVPGEGTFEATESTVRVRPSSPVRDQLQRATGHRFFSQETTGDGRH